MAVTINASTSAGLISTADTSGILQLQTANTAALTVDGSQNVGIGTASAGTKLDVVGAVRSFVSGGTPIFYLSNGTTQHSIQNNSGSLAFYNDGTRGMDLTATGLGIGTSSPYAKIQGYSLSANVPVGWLYRGTQGSGSAIPTTFGYPYLQIGASEYASSGTAIQTIGFGYVSANGNFPPAEIGIATTSTSGQTYGDLVFATRSVTTNTAATERAKITAGGFFKASTNGAYAGGSCHEFRSGLDGNYILTITNTASSPFGFYVGYPSASPNNTTNRFIDCEDSSALRFQVRSNGGIANYSANNVNLSDRREKTNFAPATSYLDKICAIPVQTYNYIDQNLEEDDGLTLGVVAQDVQAIAPELVTETNWGTAEEPKMRLSIYQTDLQYALMKCIQEQQAIIETLKADVAALKG
jgi:hypothetical protein